MRECTRHRRVGLEQELGHRLAEEVRAADDDRLGALEGDARLLEQDHHAQRRARAQAVRPRASRPALTGVSPSTSLRASISAGELHAVHVVGDRQLAEDPATASSALSCVMRSATSSSETSPGEAVGEPLDARPRRWPSAFRRRTSALRRVVADEDRGEARAIARARAVNAATSSATCARVRAATALPSMIWAAMRAGHLPLSDRGVLGHQLALGAVAGEAHDDDPAGLDAVTTPSPNAACTTSSPIR